MATVTTNNQYYTDIANAIRGKNGTETQYKPSEMAAAIQAISGGGEPEPPNDGKTRLYITVPANAMEGLPPPRNQVPLYIQQTVANGVTIDWGDGTPTETLPGTGEVNTTHTYEQAGDYIISLDPAEGCELAFGNGNTSYSVMGSNINNGRVYCNMLKKAVIGSRVASVGNNAFKYCEALLSVVFTNGITSIEDDVFYYCNTLSHVVIPSSVTNFGSRTFSYCYSLASIVIPNSVTDIATGTFENNTFGDCYGMKEYHFLSPTPPALGNTGVFSGIPSDCIIYVPVGSLQAYQTATNWATYADQMQEEPV